MKPVSGKALSWGLLIVGSAIVFVFCMQAVWISDDMDYGFVLTHDYLPLLGRVTGDETPERITGFYDILRSQAVHWQDVNGRAFAHTLIQFFCGIGGRTLFSVCNSIVFVCFILLLLTHSGTGVRCPRAVATVVGLYFVLLINHATPAFQICYVWMFSVAMLWLLWLWRAPRSAWWTAPGAFVLGVLAGNGMEALNVGMSVALFVWWVRNIRRVTPMQYVLLVGFAVGCAFLVFSPGNFARAGRAGFSILSVLWWVYYFAWLFVLVAVVLYCRLRLRESFSSMYRSAAFWWDTLLVCLLFGLAVGAWAHRIFLGSVLASLVIIVRLLPRKGFSNVWLAVTAFVTAAVLLSEWSYVSANRAEYDRISAEHLASPTGVVRTKPAAVKHIFPIVADMSYTYTMPVGDFRMEQRWRACLHTMRPQAAPLQLVPDAMPQYGDTIAAPYSAPFGEDVWVAVRPVGSDARFRSLHSIGVGPWRRPYKALDVDFSHPHVVAPGWEGVIVRCEYPFRFLALDGVEVVKE